MIDFISDVNRGLTYFAKKLKEKPYVYAQHFGGPDLMQASTHTGQTTVDFSRQLGIPLIPVEPHRLLDGIQAVRSILGSCWFDEKKCRVGIEALCQYHWRKDDSSSTSEHVVYKREPVHDWASHPADGMRHIAMAFRRGRVRGLIEPEDEEMIMADSYSVETAA